MNERVLGSGAVRNSAKRGCACGYRAFLVIDEIVLFCVGTVQVIDRRVVSHLVAVEEETAVLLRYGDTGNLEKRRRLVEDGHAGVPGRVKRAVPLQLVGADVDHSGLGPDGIHCNGQDTLLHPGGDRIAVGVQVGFHQAVGLQFRFQAGDLVFVKFFEERVGILIKGKLLPRVFQFLFECGFELFLSQGKGHAFAGIILHGVRDIVQGQMLLSLDTGTDGSIHLHHAVRLTVNGAIVLFLAAAAQGAVNGIPQGAHPIHGLGHARHVCKAHAFCMDTGVPGSLQECAAPNGNGVFLHQVGNRVHVVDRYGAAREGVGLGCKGIFVPDKVRIRAGGEIQVPVCP